jgi:hypothetical protein
VNSPSQSAEASQSDSAQLRTLCSGEEDSKNSSSEEDERKSRLAWMAEAVEALDGSCPSTLLAALASAEVHGGRPQEGMQEFAQEGVLQGQMRSEGEVPIEAAVAIDPRTAEDSLGKAKTKSVGQVQAGPETRECAGVVSTTTNSNNGSNTRPRRGKTAVGSLPLSEICVVCLGAFEPGDELRALACSHVVAWTRG